MSDDASTEAMQGHNRIVALPDAETLGAAPFWAAIGPNHEVTLEQRPISTVPDGWTVSLPYDSPFDAIEWLRAMLDERMDGYKNNGELAKAAELSWSYRRVGQLFEDWQNAGNLKARR